MRVFMITIINISPVFLLLLQSCSYLNGKERLHAEELGDPQLKVETEAVEESPDEYGPARPEPQRRDAVRAE